MFYDQSGKEQQSFDYSGDEGVREFVSCAFNPSGDTVVFGTFNRFYVFSHNATRHTWEEVRRGSATTSQQGAKHQSYPALNLIQLP